MNCDHSCKHHGPCRFGDIQDGEEFLYKNRVYCVFHAPMRAIRSRDAIKKADLSDEELTKFNEHILALLSDDDAPLSEGDPPLSTAVIRKLKSTYPGRTLGRNEFSSGWARHLRGVYLLIMKMPRNNFAHVVFPGPIAIKDRKIGRSNFQYCEFHGDIEIRNCEFVGSVTFNGTRFFVGSDFSDTIFGSDFSADHSRFMGPTYFVNTRFKDEATFAGAEFKSILHLCCHRAFEEERKMMRDVTVSRANFHDLVCLQHRSFFELNVDSAKFARPPRLGGASLSSGCSLSSASYVRCIPGDRIAYTTLQRLSASAGDREGVDLFRFLSFLALMKDKKLPRISRSALWCYKTVSSFGTDVGRAGLSLLLVNLFALPVYALALATQCRCTPTPSSAISAWASTLLKPFYNPQNGASGIGMQQEDLLIATIAFIHAIASGALLAVFLHTVYRTISRE